MDPILRQLHGAFKSQIEYRNIAQMPRQIKGPPRVLYADTPTNSIVMDPLSINYKSISRIII